MVLEYFVDDNRKVLVQMNRLQMHLFQKFDALAAVDEFALLLAQSHELKTRMDSCNHHIQ